MLSNALEAKTGKIHAKFRKACGKDEPKEWRAWYMMAEWERKEAYDSLRVSFTLTGSIEKNLISIQKSKKAFESGESIRHYESRSGEIISLVDDEDEGSKAKKEDRSIIKAASESKDNSMKNEGSFDVNTVKPEGKIKDEPTSVNLGKGGLSVVESPTSTAKKEESREALFARDNDFDSSELERKKEKARVLAEEIEMEERLAKLKREQRALHEEIEAAERKKQKCGGE
jgi:hypothetical protein